MKINELIKGMRNVEKTRFAYTFLILITLILLLIDCQNNITTIEELKSPGGSKFIGKSATVEGIFVKDPFPMLVTDLNIVTANVPMPYNQYLLLSGKEADKINPHKYGGGKVRISGIVKSVNSEQIEYNNEKLVLEVLVYKIMEVPKIPYSPTVQPTKSDSLKH